jgi:hypothetical protein
VINDNAALEISQVANGFIVRRPYNMARGDCISLDEMLVFRTMAELLDWLRAHYSHRAVVHLNDTVPAA